MAEYTDFGFMRPKETAGGDGEQQPSGAGSGFRSLGYN